MVVRLHNCAGAPHLFGPDSSNCDHHPIADTLTSMTLREFADDLRILTSSTKIALGSAALKLKPIFETPSTLRLLPNEPVPPKLGPIGPWGVALLTLAAAYEVYQAWNKPRIPIIDAPPCTTPIDQWIAEVHELGDLMQRMAELQVMMRVYEMFGFASLVHQLRDELAGLQIQLMTAANTFIIAGNHTQIKASAADDDATIRWHIDRLKSNNLDAQARAATALGMLSPKPTSAVPALIKAFNTIIKGTHNNNTSHQKNRTAIEIARTLIHLGQSNTVIDGLIQLLDREDTTTSSLDILKQAAEVLGNIRAPTTRAIPALVAAMNQHVGPTYTLLRGAITAINPDYVLPPLPKNDPSTILRGTTFTQLCAILLGNDAMIYLERKIAAAVELGRYLYTPHRDMAIAALQEAATRYADASGEWAELRNTIQASLRGLGVQSTTPEISENVYIRMLSDGGDRDKITAAIGLRRLPPEAAQHAIPALRNAGQTSNDLLGVEIGLALAHLEAIDDAVRSLSCRLLGDYDIALRAATALGDLGPAARISLPALHLRITGLKNDKLAQPFIEAFFKIDPERRLVTVEVTPPGLPHTPPAAVDTAPVQSEVSTNAATKLLASVLGIPESNVQRYLVGLAEQDFTITMEVSGKCDDPKYQQALIAALKVAVRAEIPKAHKALDRVMRFSKSDID